MNLTFYKVSTFNYIGTDPPPKLLIPSVRTTSSEAGAANETLSRLASHVDCGVKASFGGKEYQARAARFLSDTEILKRTQEMMFSFGR